MDLTKPIAELEQQAAEYTEAANALRALQSGGASAGSAAAISPAAADASSDAAPARRRGRRPKQGNAAAKAKPQGEKRYVSPETRAKIAAAIKARNGQCRQADA